MTHGYVGDVGGAVGAGRAVGDHDNVGDALGFQLADKERNREGAIHGLAAGHGDGVVVEDLVGDVHFGGHRLADGEYAGAEIGAVPQVGEDVLLAGEGRLPDPGHAFAPHLGER